MTQGYVSTNSIATLNHGGDEGFCDLEIANNPLRGTHIPAPAEAGPICIAHGLSACANYTD